MRSMSWMARREPPRRDRSGEERICPALIRFGEPAHLVYEGALRPAQARLDPVRLDQGEAKVSRRAALADAGPGSSAEKGREAAGEILLTLQTDKGRAVAGASSSVSASGRLQGTAANRSCSSGAPSRWRSLSRAKMSFIASVKVGDMKSEARFSWTVEALVAEQRRREAGGPDRGALLENLRPPPRFEPSGVHPVALVDDRHVERKSW
jgi:hypothetical protein